ncbi:asialoglycoprotein receptor 1-like [Nothobranchius furzeri]|uniref:asialoglycoprotein receptor 1-like n=1 Tax=Nothobranchius furzeri TaxID=105023 RepID=UPI002403AE0E|nr:asialoglycoprotein receptor 1-like [Nothobranchius furzeri]
MEEMDIDDNSYKKLLTPGGCHRSKQLLKHAVVCLGFLCVVLLAGNIGQFFFYETHCTAVIGVLQTNNNITTQNYEIDSTEKNGVQSMYKYLSVNKNHLEVRMRNLTNEKEELQKDELEVRFRDVTSQRDQLQTQYGTLKNESDQLKTSYDEMKQSFREIVRNHKNFTADANQLQTKYTDLQREKEELRANFTAFVQNTDRLQRTYSSSVRHEKHQLQQSLDIMNKSKSQTENNYKQLLTNYSSLVTDTEKLQKNLNKMTDKVRGMLCPKKWTKFKTSCYFVSTERRNWTESRHACVDEGADLMIIDSHEEQVFVNRLLHKDQNAWIGLTDSVEDGVWMWLDGNTVTTTFWQAEQPNNYGGNQDCGELVQTQSGGEWNDDGCFSKQISICEK